MLGHNLTDSHYRTEVLFCSTEATCSMAPNNNECG
jgi:hypothetical protein